MISEVYAGTKLKPLSISKSLFARPHQLSPMSERRLIQHQAYDVDQQITSQSFISPQHETFLQETIMKPKLQNLSLPKIKSPAAKQESRFTTRHRSLQPISDINELRSFQARPFPDSYFNSVRAIVAERFKHEPSQPRHLRLDKINLSHQSNRQVDKQNQQLASQRASQNVQEQDPKFFDFAQS